MQNNTGSSRVEPRVYPGDFGPNVNPIGKTVREDQLLPKKTIIDIDEPAPIPVAPEQKPKSDTSSPYGGTIPPWAISGGFPMMSYCKLTPLPSAPNEKHLPREVELKGEYNELNRGNLDPDNFSISQKIQAVLTCKDGKWFIKDQSPYKTTFVLASEEVPLKAGDVILMGSRRFVFTEE